MAIVTLADVKRLWAGEKLRQQIERAAGRGVQAAAIFLVARVKEILSVPAPRRIAWHQSKGVFVRSYQAKTRATPGAPPRKLSGKLRASINYAMEGPMRARVGTRIKYARPLELRMNHQFLRPTAVKFRRVLLRIMIPRRGR